MKNTKIKIMDSFVKAYREEVVVSEITLENNKKFIVNIDTNKGHIVAKSTVESNKEKLKEDEKIAIIEVIIRSCATFINSILKASISLYIQGYNFVDNTTSEYIISDGNIIQEFVKSKYADDTEDEALKALLDMYKQASKNINKLGKEKIEINIPNVFFIHKCDARHFFAYALYEYKDKIDLNYKNNIVVLMPK